MLSSIVAAMVALLPMLAIAPKATAATPVTGGGSSFAALEFQQWSRDVASPPLNLTVNYITNSSGAGRSNYAQGVYEYGASDIAYNPLEDGSLAQEAAKNHPYAFVDVSAGGLAFMYSLVLDGQRVNNLYLTRQDVCQIFTGQLSTWSQLAATTPQDAFLANVNVPIYPITRSDSAGESYVLSQYCLAVDPGDWSKFVSWVVGNDDNGQGYDGNLPLNQPISEWPQTLPNDNATQASGADAVANGVQDPNKGTKGVQGTITYVATAYAVVRNWPVAWVQNGAAGGGTYTQPNAYTVQDALSYATPVGDGTFHLQFTANDPDAYFPSTYTYAIAPVTADPGVMSTIAQFLCYATGKGQLNAARLRYAPLSQQVTAIAVSQIDKIPGASAIANCGVGGPAPNVVPGKPSGPPPVNSVQSTGGGSPTDTSSAQSPGGNNGTSGPSSTADATATTVPAAAGQPAGGAATTTTTVAGALTSGVGPTAGLNQQAIAAREAAVQAASRGPDYAQAFWWLLAGAAIAAVIVGVSARRRSSS